MKIKKGDTVKVIAGKDRGKTGKVVKSLPREQRVVVEGVNIVTKHVKPKGPQEPGGLTKVENPIHVSNVMYYDEKTKKGTRIGYRFEDGKKVRYKKSDGSTIK
ncbi:50S ribosomal protein L24 [Peptoniphilus sp. GNH]|nr:ribosomal protein L24 [Clostridiales bacterium KA00134]UHR02480.1 50S ribosomal protein L24 [Peptoniphilus sp. GNH]